MYRSGSSTANTLLNGLTWSKVGSVVVGESPMGSAGVAPEERRRLCRPRVPSLTGRRPPTARLVLQSTSTSARKHLR